MSANYQFMKLAELMALCSKRGLDGEDAESKAELIALLRADDQARAKPSYSTWKLVDLMSEMEKRKIPNSEDVESKAEAVRLLEQDDRAKAGGGRPPISPSAGASKSPVRSVASNSPPAALAKWASSPAPPSTSSVPRSALLSPTKPMAQSARSPGGALLPKARVGSGGPDKWSASASATPNRFRARGGRQVMTTALTTEERSMSPPPSGGGGGGGGGVRRGSLGSVGAASTRKGSFTSKSADEVKSTRVGHDVNANTRGGVDDEAAIRAFTRAAERQLMFTINNTLTMGGSGGEKKYTAYAVEVVDKKTGETINIARRFRQFEDLSKAVTAHYPANLAPYFTREKRFGAGNMDAAFLQKRCDKLQRYLNEMSKLPNVWAMRELRAFLVDGDVDGGGGGAGRGGGKQRAIDALDKDDRKRMKDDLKDCRTGGGKELHFSSYGFGSVPDVVYREFAQTLQMVNLEFNTFGSMPDLSNFPKLRAVRLGGNQIASLERLHMLPRLVSLTVNGNRLRELPRDISALVKLEKLDASNNSLTSVPREISHLTSLEDLNVNGNQIDRLPSEMGGCFNMEICDLQGNRLRSLPEEFCYMTRLMELNLGNQSPGLEALPRNMGRLTRLVQLNVSDNQLTELPVSLGLCDGLGGVGSGYNIDRNPFRDERLLAKIKLGNDHVVRHTQIRLQEWQDLQKKIGRTIDPVDEWRGLVRKKDGSVVPWQPGPPTGGPVVFSTPGGGGSAASSPALPRRNGGGGGGGGAGGAPDGGKTEADKVQVLCQFASREINGKLVSAFKALKQDLAAATTLEAAAPPAKKIRAFRKELDALVSTTGVTLPKAPPPNLNISDKVILMKMILKNVCKEIDQILEHTLLDLDTIDTTERAVQYCRVVKQIVASSAILT